MIQRKRNLPVHCGSDGETAQHFADQSFVRIDTAASLFASQKIQHCAQTDHGSWTQEHQTGLNGQEIEKRD